MTATLKPQPLAHVGKQGDDALALSVVMPCLNEAKTLGACIAKSLDAFERLDIAAEVIVADNGSTDGSIEIAREAGARVVHVAERGYGAALIGGLAAARAPYAIYADGDGSYDFGEIGAHLDRLKDGADLVLGSRFPAGGGRIDPGAMPWLHRYVGTPALTFLCRLLYGVRITDINSGMRGVRTEAFRQLRVLATGMEFSSEIILQMARRGFRIEEVPITLHKDGRDRTPHLRTWRDGWRHLCILLIYSPTLLYLVPGFVLTLLGFAVLIALLPGALVVGGVSLSTNSRIVASLVTLSGSQILLFGLLAKYLAQTQGLYGREGRFVDRFRTFARRYAIPTGLSVFLLGGGVVVYAFKTWSDQQFGSLVNVEADRILAPAAVLCVFGVQLIASAFFAMLLDIVRHK